MPTNWLDAHAGAVQGMSTIVLVAVTIALVWVTRTYAEAAKRQAEQSERQVEETRQQRFDQHRPVVHPSGSLPLTNNSSVDWSQLDFELLLRNVGTGVALTLCGVLFPPEPEAPPSTLPPRYTMWRESPLLPGTDGRSGKLATGGTIMNGDATIDGHRLFAPRKPTYQEMTKCGKYNVLARLTLTYEDIFKRKHAAIYDFIDIHGWQCVALLPGILEDLEDVDREARGLPMSGASSPVVQPG